MAETFNVKIKESFKELTAREKIMLKDTRNATPLEEVSRDGEFMLINPVNYAILAIHNEKADDKDYEQYVIMDGAGNKYVTGSQSFWNSFKGIFDEMISEGEEFTVSVYQIDSKNYKGKKFLTCSLI